MAKEGEKSLGQQQQEIILGKEKLAQAEKLKLSELEKQEIVERQLELRTQILKSRSEDMKLSQKERDIARLKLKDREAELALSREITEELREQVREAETLQNAFQRSIDKVDLLTVAWKQGFAGQLVSSFKNLDKIGARLKKNLTFTNIGGTLLDTSMQLAKQVSDITSEMAKNTGQGAELNGVFDDVATSSRSFGVGFAESAQAVTALSTSLSGFKSMNSDTQAELATTVARLEAFGVASETTAANLDIARQVMGLSTDQAIQMQKDMAALASGIGMPAGKLAESFKAAAPQLASYGSNMVGVFEDLAKTSKKTGIEISDLLGITQQFDTFEGAANAAGQLNSILGGGLLNSTELLMASESERLEMIRNSIAASGRSFDSMGRFQKMAIANAAGIKDMAQATKLFSEQARAQQEETELNAVSQEELEKRQKATVSITKQLEMGLQALAVVVLPVISVFTGFMNIILSINDFFGGSLIPIILGFTAVAYGLKAAVFVLTAAKKGYLAVSAMWQAGGIREIAIRAKNAAMTFLGIGAQTAETAAKDKDTLSNASNTVSELSNSGAKAASAGASGLLTGAQNVETASKRSGILVTIAMWTWNAILAVGKGLLSLATWALVGAFGAEKSAKFASATMSFFAAGATSVLGAVSAAATIPIGLLAIAVGLVAIGLALFAQAVVGLVTVFIEFIKYLIESPDRIATAVVAFMAMGGALSVIGLAMFFVAGASFALLAGITSMVGGIVALSPAILGFIGVMGGLAIGVGILGLAFGLLAVSMVAIAVSMASIVKSTAQMATGSGILEFRSSVSGLVDDLERLEESMSILEEFSTGTMVMAASMNMVASSLIFMSFGLSLVSEQLSNMAESMKNMEGVNASFETVMATATTITPETVANVEGLVNQAERYTASQVELKSIGSVFSNALESLAGTITGSINSAKADGTDKDIILVLNDRELGRVIGNKISGKMKLNTA